MADYCGDLPDWFDYGLASDWLSMQTEIQSRGSEAQNASWQCAEGAQKLEGVQAYTVIRAG